MRSTCHLLTIFCVLAVAACDRPVAPHSVGRSTGRVVYGDFVRPVDSIALPAVVTLGDALNVTPHFAAGPDACGSGPVVMTTDSYAVVVTWYGVRVRGSKCKTRSYTVPLTPSPWAVPPPPADPAQARVLRLIVCRPNGLPLRRDVLVRRRDADPQFFPPPSDSAVAVWEAEGAAEVEARCDWALGAVR